MALTANQKERMQVYKQGGGLVIVTIHPRRKYPRELGEKTGQTITVHIEHGDSKDFAQMISFCTDQYEAMKKGKEIAVYLADELGLTREIVKLRHGKGK